MVIFVCPFTLLANSNILPYWLIVCVYVLVISYTCIWIFAVQMCALMYGMSISLHLIQPVIQTLMLVCLQTFLYIHIMYVFMYLYIYTTHRFLPRNIINFRIKYFHIFWTFVFPYILNFSTSPKMEILEMEKFRNYGKYCISHWQLPFTFYYLIKCCIVLFCIIAHL